MLLLQSTPAFWFIRPFMSLRSFTLPQIAASLSSFTFNLEIFCRETLKDDRNQNIKANGAGAVCRRLSLPGASLEPTCDGRP